MVCSFMYSTKIFFFVFFGQNLSKPDQSSDGRKGVVMIGPNSCRLEIERPFQNFKNRVKEFSIFSTVLVKTSLHKFGKPISHQIFHSPLKYLLLEYCRLVWPQWWNFADVSQQGLHFSKKISKRKIFFWFDLHRCSHGSSKSA